MVAGDIEYLFPESLKGLDSVLLDKSNLDELEDLLASFLSL